MSQQQIISKITGYDFDVKTFEALLSYVYPDYYMYEKYFDMKQEIINTMLELEESDRFIQEGGHTSDCKCGCREMNEIELTQYLIKRAFTTETALHIIDNIGFKIIEDFEVYTHYNSSGLRGFLKPIMIGKSEYIRDLTDEENELGKDELLDIITNEMGEDYINIHLLDKYLVVDKGVLCSLCIEAKTIYMITRNSN
jgi:hypothetical protein